MSLVAPTPVALMEPLIIERLRLAFPEKTFQIQRVPAVLTIKEFERVTRLTPFIGLAFMAFKADKDAGRLLAGVANWRLVLVVRATSSLEARFKGDRYDIGLDAMIDVAAILLHGVTLGQIGPMAVTAAEAIYADGHGDDATVMAQLDFEVRYTAPLSGLGLRAIDDFRRLGVTWLTNDVIPGSPENQSEIEVQND